MKKIFFRSILLLLAVSVFLGCSPKEDQSQNSGKTMPKTEGAHYPVTITTYNYAGEPEDLHLKKPRKRLQPFTKALSKQC